MLARKARKPLVRGRVSRPFEREVNYLRKQVHREGHATSAESGGGTQAATGVPQEDTSSIPRSLHASSESVFCKSLSTFGEHF